MADDDPTPLRPRDAWDVLLNPTPVERVDEHDRELDRLRADVADLNRRLERLEAPEVQVLPVDNAFARLAAARESLRHMYAEGRVDEADYIEAEANLAAVQVTLYGRVPPGGADVTPLPTRGD